MISTTQHHTLSLSSSPLPLSLRQFWDPAWTRQPAQLRAAPTTPTWTRLRPDFLTEKDKKKNPQKTQTSCHRFHDSWFGEETIDDIDGAFVCRACFSATPNSPDSIVMQMSGILFSLFFFLSATRLFPDCTSRQSCELIQSDSFIVANFFVSEADQAASV